MFYGLTGIGGEPLPGPLAFNGRPRVIVADGLLLVPPGTRRTARAGIGEAILSVSGPPCPDGTPGWAMTLNAPYRWATPGQLELTRDEDPERPQFVGTRDGRTVVLRPGAGDCVASGDLRFDEACHEPPTDTWRRLFWGGPHRPVPPRAGDTDEMHRVRMQQFVAAAWDAEGRSRTGSSTPSGARAPNDALRLSSMRGRGSGATASVVHDHRSAPRTRS